jgi:hypothetical protein
MFGQKIFTVKVRLEWWIERMELDGEKELVRRENFDDIRMVDSLTYKKNLKTNYFSLPQTPAMLIFVPYFFPLL